MKRKVITVSLVLTLLFGFILNASAYILMNIGYADPDIDYKSNSNVDAIYKYAMSYAMNSWNDAACDCTVSSSTGSSNYLETYSTSTTELGRYTLLASNGQPTHSATGLKLDLTLITGQA